MSERKTFNLQVSAARLFGFLVSSYERQTGYGLANANVLGAFQDVDLIHYIDTELFDLDIAYEKDTKPHYEAIRAAQERRSKDEDRLRATLPKMPRTLSNKGETE
jgi:hypothetical protein